MVSSLLRSSFITRRRSCLCAWFMAMIRSKLLCTPTIAPLRCTAGSLSAADSNDPFASFSSSNCNVRRESETFRNGIKGTFGVAPWAGYSPEEQKALECSRLSIVARQIVPPPAEKYGTKNYNNITNYESIATDLLLAQNAISITIVHV